MPRVVVTGAAGFIGSHVCEALTRAGWQVVGVDAFTGTYNPDAKRANVAALLRDPLFQLVPDDVLDADLPALLDGADVVLHLAGEPGVASSWGSAFCTYVDRNVLATARLLDTSSALRVPRFVYASSSSVYRPSAVAVTEAAPVGPLSPYGVSKLAGESLVGAYAAERELETVALRFFSVYGPRQRPDMAGHRFVEAMLDGREIEVYGSGEQRRDFTYVEDVVTAVVASLTADLPAGAVLNIAHGEPVTVSEVLRLLGEELGAAPRVRRLPHRHGDAPATHGDPSAARRLLGWEPGTGIREGLRQQVAWQVARRVPTGRAAPGAAPVEASMALVRELP